MLVLCFVVGCSTSPQNKGTGSHKTVYADGDNWLALPMQTKHQADVIYFYPTTYHPVSSDAPLICESVEPAKYAMPAESAAFFGTESYHGWDYEFYYMNIRENAALRLEHFLKR